MSCSVKTLIFEAGYAKVTAGRSIRAIFHLRKLLRQKYATYSTIGLSPNVRMVSFAIFRQAKLRFGKVLDASVALLVSYQPSYCWVLFCVYIRCTPRVSDVPQY